MDNEKSRKEMKEKEPEKRNRKSDEERFSEYSENPSLGFSTIKV